VDPLLQAELRRLTAAEDDTVAAARERAEGSVRTPSPEAGALFAWIARLVGARTAVEVGAAGGVAGIWLLQGLAGRGALTSVEPDPHAHGLATATYEATGVGAQVRSILGDPATVLPRLSDGGYDLVLLQPEAGSTPALLEHARRLLRAGGMLVVRDVARRGDHAEARARFLQQLVEDPAFRVVVLPLDDGIVLADRLADETAEA
jgi:predicted O-methyltransferase YrrM